MADIDWELDILYPSLKEMEELEAQGEQVEVELEPGDEA